MADTPFEISVTLNATAQLMDEMSGPYKKQAAVAPSTHMENICGYDVEYPFLKGIFVQFKRPHLLEYNGDPFSFHTDHNDGEQLETLQGWAERYPRSTFYAFPLVPKDAALDETLARTLFIDASCLLEDTSRVRVRTQPAGSDTSAIPEVVEVKAKVRGGDWYPLNYPSACCRTWNQFRAGLESSRGGLDPRVQEQYAEGFEDEYGETPEDVQLERAMGPVGLTLYQDGTPVSRSGLGAEDDEQSVLDRMSKDAEEESFWEKGLTAGLFER